MWNEPSLEELAKLPRLYDTEDLSLKKKVIHMHFFLGGCDWYTAEYSPDERNFFGYVILNANYENAEWGYMSFDELRETKTPHGFEVDRDLYWKPTKAGDVEKIRRGYKRWLL